MPALEGEKIIWKSESLCGLLTFIAASCWCSIAMATGLGASSSGEARGTVTNCLYQIWSIYGLRSEEPKWSPGYISRGKCVGIHPDEFLNVIKLKEEGDEGEEQEERGLEREELEWQLVKRLIETEDDSCDSWLHKP